MVPQLLPRGRFGIHKQPMTLTITLCCLSKRNIGILLAEKKRQRHLSERAFHIPSPPSMWNVSLNMKQALAMRMGLGTGRVWAMRAELDGRKCGSMLAICR